MAEDVRAFPVREREGVYEVLIVPEDMWLPCQTEQDARAIAAASLLEDDSLSGRRTGKEFASELDETANALEKYGISFGSRSFRRRAAEARMKS